MLRFYPRRQSLPGTTCELHAVRRCALPESCLAFGLADAPALQSEDHLADLDLLAFLDLNSLTMPVTDDGTSTTALSVSSSMTGWPSETLLPGEIIRRTRSP